MKTRIAISCIALLTLASTGAFAQTAVIPLTGDTANSTGANYGGSLAGALSDPFAYDPDNPTSAMPVNAYPEIDGEWFHSNNEQLAVLSYYFDAVYSNIFIDFYGRSDCCTERDDNFDVEFYLGGVLQETVSGDGLIDADFHGRVTATTTTEADYIRILETNDPSNTFALVELRANGTPLPLPPVITASSPFAVEGESFSLTATAGGTGYQWSVDGENIGTDDPVYDLGTLDEADTGIYTVQYDNGVAKTVVSATYDLLVYPAGTEVPLTGLLGLGLLAGACAVGGAAALRRKK